jgi:lysozyme
LSYRDIVKYQLRIDEGVKNRPYKDSVGKLTIGVGRNLDDVGVNDDEIDLMLENDLDEAERTVRRVLVGAWDDLNDARKAVLCNMAFNLGFDRLSGFKKLIAAVREGRYADAADEMLTSKWAEQVGLRAVRLSAAMRHE